ncbi:hypothetical protein CWI38_0076p0080 [Hamiltosporidium tvaerminnensis]|uniref:Integrase catalytic domain-containing protein n=3 Tax=Hamiltosporidium TaxID=1176354 RepID=A0A4Q9M192_9MICR|nr:hypothetical protein CWI38_0076p0080 [Hamiltosporidium tvaerminnensis]
MYSKEEKRLLRQKVEYFTLFRDEICFKRRDHLIRAFFGFETALIQQITQIEHSVAHISVNKRIALIIKKYYGILKAYIKEYVKDCEACSRLNSLKTIQPIYINHIIKKYDLFMMDCVDFRRYSDQNDQSFLTDLNIKIILVRPRNLKAQGQVERVNQTLKRWLATKLHETGGKGWIEHLVITIHKATNKSPFMLFFEQPGLNNLLSRSIIVENEAGKIVPAIDIDPDIVSAEENAADTQWILEIASDLHEEVAETVTTITTIIADDHESDGNIRSDFAKHFKNYREENIRSNNLNRLNMDLSI